MSQLLESLRAWRATLSSPQPKLAPVDGPADGILTGAVIALVVFGVVMVYSASSVFAARVFHDGEHFLIRQAVFAAIGLPLMVVLAHLDYRRFRFLTYPLLGTAAFLMLVITLGFGRSAGGAARWIPIGPFHVQPAEVAKLAIIFWLAHSLSKKNERIRSFSIGFLPHALMALFLMGLCMQQPDFGSAVMIGLLTFVLLWVAGAKTSYVFVAVALAVPVAYLAVTRSEYRMERIRAFLNPFEHRHDIGYQITESLISFGSGGVGGVGIGDSLQKLFFLPEAHTDFISAIVGEETGFVGICALVGVYLLIVVRGLRAAFRAPDDYGMYLAVGITTFLGVQAFTNLSVAMGLLPTKGLVLPFMSYGGSALLVNCAAMGVLLNVSRSRAEDPVPTTTAESVTSSRGLGALAGAS